MSYEASAELRLSINDVLISIAVDDFSLQNFEIEVGGMNYGFDINGILGMDFLFSFDAIINLMDMVLQFNT